MLYGTDGMVSKIAIYDITNGCTPVLMFVTEGRKARKIANAIMATHGCDHKYVAYKSNWREYVTYWNRK